MIAASSSSTSKPHSDANSKILAPDFEFPATNTLPPLSMNSVIFSTFKSPPNSSVSGAKITRFWYKNSPCLDKTKEASSANL